MECALSGTGTAVLAEYEKEECQSHVELFTPYPFPTKIAPSPPGQPALLRLSLPRKISGSKNFNLEHYHAQPRIRHPRPRAPPLPRRVSIHYRRRPDSCAIGRPRALPQFLRTLSRNGFFGGKRTYIFHHQVETAH